MGHEEIDFDGAAESLAQVAPDWLRINVTTAALAPGTVQCAELELLHEQQRRSDGVFDEEALAGLAESGWLRQDVQARGAFLSTNGLRSRLDHPELVMFNVPVAMIGWASMVFGGMAYYIDEEGARLAAGELYMELLPPGPAVFTFAAMGEEAAKSVGFESVEDELLLVIPLP